MEPDISRYSRHELLRVIGNDGQEKIAQSRVFVAGLGALGSLIAMLLARAGVGFLRIIDLDAPETHNLQRQLLYTETHVKRGVSKAQAALEALKEVNSEIEIESITASIGRDNIESLTDGIDLVVDALDNITTRYFVNDTILKRRIPYVFGGAVETSGNIMTIIPGRTPCLRCLWPESDAVKDHASASTVGVLSATAAAVASIEVAEVIKVLTGSLDDTLSGLLVMDLWKNMYHVVPVDRDPSCKCHTVV